MNPINKKVRVSRYDELKKIVMDFSTENINSFKMTDNTKHLTSELKSTFGDKWKLSEQKLIREFNSNIDFKYPNPKINKIIEIILPDSFEMNDYDFEVEIRYE